jgi:hypothetical protein
VARGKRVREAWNPVTVVVLGFDAGFYVIAMLLPYVSVDYFVP